MEAILLAKRAGMNVTCEVTPHHLFLDESARELIGGGGCMKPSLKSEADRDFLWEHIDDIDIFASDCAPHRPSDKMGEHPAYGVTNHTVMLPLLLGAVKEGRLTMDDVYQKFCINPRTRFGLPVEDGSFVKLDTHYSFNAAYYDSKASYLDSPFRSLEQLGQRFRMVGQVVAAQAGVSTIRRGTRFDRKDSIRPSLTHLIRPKNLTTQVLRAAQERA
jgi:carbamoyl-phosphate synthase/aspartate carbamoyltransferase/dihydroorotase